MEFYLSTQMESGRHDTVGGWAKRCYFAGRAVMDATLRPYGLGSTQWYVLYHLANEGSTRQSDLLRSLHIERASMSGVVATLQRKGLINQVQAADDQRQKCLRMTAAGTKLWGELPDLRPVVTQAFDGIDADDLATTLRVLSQATEQLDRLLKKGNIA
ncbi:MarR family transcriptional regulator [Brucella sp. BE17]|uniref:MarR family winged helix-turn-helix transcriptional regulator n=1 Tax=Brucella sp. BE17 TaxID=3142977 RepID=UPI0031BBC21A